MTKYENIAVGPSRKYVRRKSLIFDPLPPCTFLYDSLSAPSLLYLVRNSESNTNKYDTIFELMLDVKLTQYSEKKILFSQKINYKSFYFILDLIKIVGKDRIFDKK